MKPTNGALPEIKVCLHVTSAAALPSILKQGLLPMLGPLSSQIESHPAIFMFPSWADMMGATWLLSEDWPYESEPILLCVNTANLDLSVDAGFEVRHASPIAANLVSVLAPTEFDWDKAEELFYSLGGREHSLTAEEVFAMLEKEDSARCAAVV
jgi:hypothetical protein